MAITITPAPMPIAFTSANTGKINANEQSTTDPASHTSESESESSHLNLNQDHRLVEEEALRILARSKRRKLDDIPARERWRCPNELCGREYKRTSTTSIGHHRETCPHRPILKARALLQLNPQHLAVQNFSHLNSIYSGNPLLTDHRLQLLQHHQAQQLNMQSMNIYAASQPTTTTSNIQTQQLSHAPTNGMMLNMPSMISSNENPVYPSMSMSLQSSMLSIPSLNYLPMPNATFGTLSASNSVHTASAFNPVFNTTSHSHSLPMVATNSAMELNTRSNVPSLSYQNQLSGISTFSIPTQASLVSSAMDVSSHTSSSSQPSSSSVTLVKPIARRRVDHIPSIPVSSSNSIVTTPHESPRSLYFTGSAFSFPLQKIPANPFGEKQ